MISLFESVKELLKDGFEPFDFRPDFVTHLFKAFCPAHKLHDLRHTFATNCFAAGVPMKVIQVWLGHSTIDTTADIYTHMTAGVNADEADKINKAYGNVKKEADTKIDTTAGDGEK